MAGEIQHRLFVLPTVERVRSLCWYDDVLIDWVSGGRRFRLDGSMQDRSVLYGYRFNAALTSQSGRFAVIYERTGTKGLVLDGGKIVREINRSFYHADAYEYPIALFTLPDGREALAHCPDEYNRLEIDELDSGNRLTTSNDRSPADVFHSRLSVSADGRRLLSAGWFWHPFDSVLVYDILEALSNPKSLDEVGPLFRDRGCEINSAAFIGDDKLLLTSNDDADDFFDDEAAQSGRLTPGCIAIFDMANDRFDSLARLENTAGTVMPVGDLFTIGFFEHPKLIDIKTGRVLVEWTDIASGKQKSSIIWNDLPPPMGLDPHGRRFAVGSSDKIFVVLLD